MRQVDVSTGKNHTEFWFAPVSAGGEIQRRDRARLKERSDGDRGARLDDNFEALPDKTHGGDDLGLGDAKDSREIFAEDSERAWRERSAEAVGDGVGGVERL